MVKSTCRMTLWAEPVPLETAACRAPDPLWILVPSLARDVTKGTEPV